MTVKTFISRPLFSLVISVFIVLLGVISLLSLPVERYPDIAPPAIYVWASYPGASAETVHKSVVMPLEEAINGVEGMTYMTSSASNGSASITIYFEQGANADMAAVNVQNRVIQAQAQLPAEVLQTGVATEKRQPGQLRIIALESPNGTYDENFLSNYFYNNLRPALLRIKGVGANSSRTIGVCVVGGMLFGTLGLLLTVPVLFVVFQKIQERIGKNRSHQ